jgi:hypothetical protein
MTKKFKKMNQGYILETFSKWMIKNIHNVNIKIHNYFYIIEVSNFMEPNKCIYLNVFYVFLKFDESNKSKV